jgi:hypothetical protein
MEAAGVCEGRGQLWELNAVSVLSYQRGLQPDTRFSADSLVSRKHRLHATSVRSTAQCCL